ncbi:MAG: response regulator [Bdellovibrionales bacterium]
MFFDYKKDKTPKKRKPSSIRVIETDDNLTKISAEDFIIGGFRAPLAIAYISPYVDFAKVTEDLCRLAGTTTVVAVTTAGELCSSGGNGPLYKPTGREWHSVVVQVFPDDLFEAISIQYVPLHNDDIRQGSPSTERAMRIRQIARSLDTAMPPFPIDVRDTVALTFIDGLSSCENYFMEAVYQTGHFPCLFIGGSAGGKFDFKHTYIFDGRNILENHAVIIFLKLRKDRTYGVLKSQNFQKTGKSFIVIEANADRRIAYSASDPVTKEVKSFVTLLSEALGTTPGNISDKLKGYTFGVEINGELYIRSVSNGHVERGGLSFFCDVNSGDKLELLKATDFVEQTRKDIKDFLVGKQKPLGAVLSDCILRRINNESQLADMSGLWPMPVAGFSTFGELFGININQTLTALVFFDVPEAPQENKFIADFPIHYARFLNYFSGRYDLSHENLEAARKKLEMETEKTSAIMENLLEGIVTFDALGVIHTFSKGAEQTFGYAAGDIIGKKIGVLMPALSEDEKDGIFQHYLMYSGTKFVDLERDISGCRKNGETFPLNLKISRVVMGNVPVFVGVVRDGTLQKKREEAFRLAKESADAANQAKSEFLINVSRELRTPLNSIIGMNKLLKDTYLNQEQRELTEAIYSSSINLLEIIGDISDLSKIEAGDLTLEYVGFDPKAVFDAVVNSLEQIANEKKIVIEKKYINEKFPPLMGDSAHFSSILMNLIGNAIRYTEKGHVEIRSFCKRTGEGHVELYCEIIDTGIGVSKDMQDKIFEKSTRIDASPIQKIGGSCLGLAVTRHLVELMKGKIGVTSEVGKGSTFWFEIPFEIAEKLFDENFVHAEKKSSDKVYFRKARVLVAEDHPTNRLLIKKILEKFGIVSFDLFENGEAAVKAYKEKPYDLILMDCHMPVKDGYEATKDIREHEKMTKVHTPIVAMTSNAMLGDREKCLQCGMDNYISKPLGIDTLKVILSQWIQFV